MRSTWILAIGTTSLLLFLACVMKTPIGPMRATTTAPSLEYLPPAQVRTTMWVLAAEVRELERMLADPSGGDPEALRSGVSGTLARMRIASQALDQPGRSSQIHVINLNLGRFLQRIEQAERAAKRQPPNFFPASTLAGSCFLCHGQTSGTASRAPDRPSG